MCVFAAHAGSAVVLGPGLTEATVSVEAFFTIASVDAYGNRYSDGPDGPSGPLSWYSNAHGPDRYQVLLQSPSAGSSAAPYLTPRRQVRKDVCRVRIWSLNNEDGTAAADGRDDDAAQAFQGTAPLDCGLFGRSP